jgi:hypothetical protein
MRFFIAVLLTRCHGASPGESSVEQVSEFLLSSEIKIAAVEESLTRGLSVLSMIPGAEPIEHSEPELFIPFVHEDSEVLVQRFMDIFISYPQHSESQWREELAQLGSLTRSVARLWMLWERI